MALVLIDVINDLDFREGRQRLLPAPDGPIHPSSGRRGHRDARVPVIYVNDNFGRWRSDFNSAGRTLPAGRRAGSRPIAEMLRPRDDDYFVLKPKHSGFFSTTLDLLLGTSRLGRLILTGMRATICVLFTANDAYMRGYEIVVPADCVASNTRERIDHALAEMATVLKARHAPVARGAARP